MAVTSSATYSSVAVLDKNGDIVSVNREWETFGARNGLSERYTCVGKNYVSISEQTGDKYGDRVAAELRCLLTGDQTEFAVIYPCHSPKQDRWFRLYATAVSFDDNRYYLLIHQRVNQETPSRGISPSEVGDDLTRSVDDRERSRLVTYSLSSDESATEGFLMAFDAIGIDTRRQDTSLQDWIDHDVINAFQTSDSDFYVTFPVWNYPVGLTPEKVIIYTPEDSSE